MPLTLMLHGRHQLPGQPPVAYEDYGPWLVPWRFAAFEDEYQAIRSDAALIDASTQAVIECRGADRVAFLHRLLTNDIKRLAPGEGCRAALLTDSGKLVAELLVLADTEAMWLLCDLTAAPHVTQALERFHITEDIAIINHERRDALLTVEGPAALDRLRRLANAPDALPQPLAHQLVSLNGLPVRLVRHSLLSTGVSCLVESSSMEPLWRLLIGSGLPPAGWQAWMTARIEAGVPLFGIDMDQTNLLPETGLEGALCSDTKGCYLGQEIVARMATYGSPNKRLMGLLIDGRTVPESGDRLERDGEEAGWVTSAAMSPRRRAPVALGYVKRPACEEGARLRVATAGGAVEAAVVSRASISETRSCG